MFSVIENHLAREENRRRLELRRCNVGPRLGGIFPAAGLARVITRLVALHLVDHAGVRDGSRSVVDPHLVTVGVISVMMSVEGEANRLVGERANLRQYISRARREVRVNDQNIVFEYDPAVIAVSSDQIALVE